MDSSNLNTTPLENDWDMCTICLEPIEEYDEEISNQTPLNQRITRLACEHVFHEDCFSQWRSHGRGNVNECPLCRRELSHQVLEVFPRSEEALLEERPDTDPHLKILMFFTALSEFIAVSSMSSKVTDTEGHEVTYRNSSEYRHGDLHTEYNPYFYLYVAAAYVGYLEQNFNAERLPYQMPFLRGIVLTHRLAKKVFHSFASWASNQGPRTVATRLVSEPFS